VGLRLLKLRRFRGDLEAYLRSEKPDFVFTVGAAVLKGGA
jgi:hypothetical protein